MDELLNDLAALERGERPEDAAEVCGRALVAIERLREAARPLNAIAETIQEYAHQTTDVRRELAAAVEDLAGARRRVREQHEELEEARQALPLGIWEDHKDSPGFPSFNLASGIRALTAHHRAALKRERDGNEQLQSNNARMLSEIAAREKAEGPGGAERIAYLEDEVTRLAAYNARLRAEAARRAEEDQERATQGLPDDVLILGHLAERSARAIGSLLYSDTSAPGTFGAKWRAEAGATVRYLRSRGLSWQDGQRIGTRVLEDGPGFRVERPPGFRVEQPSE